MVGPEDSTQPTGAPPDFAEVVGGGFTSLVLSMLDYWIVRMEPLVVMDLLETHFTQEQVWMAHCSLTPGVKVTFNQPSVNRPGGKAQAEGLHNLMRKLIKENKVPRFTVSSQDLGRVSTMVTSLSLRDEKSVSSRLESLELTMRRMQESIMNVRQVPTMGFRGGQGFQGGHDAQPQGRQEFQEVVQGDKELQGKRRRAAPAPVIVVNENHMNNSEVNTFAEAAAKAATLTQTRGQGWSGVGRQGQGQGLRLTPHGQVEVRGRSPSQKRDRENRWETVENQNVRKVKKTIRKTEVGTSSVDLSQIGAAAQAGPIQYYIGNTTGRAEKEDINEVLMKCAENLDPHKTFEVLDIELLTKVENPRSKCWKVVVPYHCREIMEKPEMFPPGWRHRRFYSGSGGNIRSDKRQKVKSAEEMEQEVQEFQQRVQQEQENERMLVSQPGTAGAPPAGSAQGSA